MADTIFDAVGSHNPSPTSFLDQLPGKRIDEFVRKTARQGMLQQGLQTGGYVGEYANWSHIPLFSLYSEDQLKVLAKHWGKVGELHDFGTVDISSKDKATIKVMEHMSGGGGTITIFRWLGRYMAGMEANTATMATEQTQLAVFTRWLATFKSGVPWFVDVLEYRYVDPNGTRAKMAKVQGNAIVLKTGLRPNDKVTIKVLDIEMQGIKGQKAWSKISGIRTSCETVILVQDSTEIPLTKIARIERMCSVFEGRELQKRFKDQWLVPVLS